MYNARQYKCEFSDLKCTCIPIFIHQGNVTRVDIQLKTIHACIKATKNWVKVAGENCLLSRVGHRQFIISS